MPARVRAPRRMMAPGTLRIRRVLVDNEPYFPIVAGDGRWSEAEALAAIGFPERRSVGEAGSTHVHPRRRTARTTAGARRSCERRSDP
jgi:hypothetical protein